MDEDEGEEDAHDKDRLESHSRAGPHSTSAGAAKVMRSLITSSESAKLR